VKAKRRQQIHQVSAAIDLATAHEEATEDADLKHIFRTLRAALEVTLDVPREYGGTAIADEEPR
jgi:hypothetical protein